ncbi:hypothetical protein [Arenimonas caeni]|jgi:antitoxin component YwqK of YwqJK toxin-antitoxin module|nr:hypothetical protein [Arenimonas caeni]
MKTLALRRSALMAAIVLGLAGCTTEHELTEAEFERLISSGKDVLEIEGEPFTGILVVRNGEKTKARFEFSDGYVDGVQEMFHANGEPQSRQVVYWDKEKERPVKDGVQQEWNPDGILVSRHEYDEGEAELVETWCDDGKDKGRKEFDDGKLRLEKTWSCDTGKLVGEAHFNAEGEPEGEQRAWSPEGQLVGRSHYVAGEKQGLRETWHPDGKPASRGEYRADKPVGKHEAWNEAGDLVESGTYGEDGEKTGLWTEKYGDSSRLVHYGPDGFISPGVSETFVRAIAGDRANAETARFLLDEGQVKVDDGLPAGYNGDPVAGRFSFPVSRWTYPVVVAHPDVLPVLLAGGADINQADSEGQTRLLRCVRQFKGVQGRSWEAGCRPDELAGLVEKGARAGIATREGRNPLHLLVLDTKRKDSDMWGRRVGAASAARAQALALLVKAGADPNGADREGHTPLSLALQSRRADLVAALLAAGAKADGAAAGGTRAVHWTVLVDANRYEIDGNFLAEVIPMLAQAGADVSAPMDWDGEQVSLRDLAVRHGLVDVAKVLDASK